MLYSGLARSVSKRTREVGGFLNAVRRHTLLATAALAALPAVSRGQFYFAADLSNDSGIGDPLRGQTINWDQIQANNDWYSSCNPITSATANTTTYTENNKTYTSTTVTVYWQYPGPGFYPNSTGSYVAGTVNIFSDNLPNQVPTDYGTYANVTLGHLGEHSNSDYLDQTIYAAGGNAPGTYIVPVEAQYMNGNDIGQPNAAPNDSDKYNTTVNFANTDGSALSATLGSLTLDITPGEGGSIVFAQSANSLYTNGACYVGYYGQATYKISGGLASFVGSLSLGQSASGNGLFQQSGGTLSVGQENIGVDGVGTFIQTGGTHSVGSLNLGTQGTFTLDAGLLTVSYNGTNSGIITWNGGPFTLNGTIGGPGYFIDNTGKAPLGTGTVACHMQTGGSLEITSGSVFTLAQQVVESTVAFTVDGGGELAFGSPTSYDIDATTSVVGPGTVAFTTGLTTIEGTYNVASTNIQGGTASFGHDVTIPGGSMTAGVLTGAGNFNISGSYNWTGGTIGSGTGTDGATNVLPAASLSIAGKSTLDARLLNNSGQVNLGSTLTLSDGAVFTNSSVMSVTTGAVSPGSGAAGAFNNLGVVNCPAGTLILNVGGTSIGGFFNLSSASSGGTGGGTLEFNSNYVIDPASSITGGSVIFNSGTPQIAGAYNTASTQITGGIANFVSTTATTGSLTMSAGTLTGIGGLAVTGNFLWTGANMDGSGVTALSGLSTIGTQTAGSSLSLDTRTLVNTGTANWLGSTLLLSNGAVMHNALGGIFISEYGGSIAPNNGSSGSFINDGTFINQTTGLTAFQVPLTGSGNLNIQSGTVSLQGGGATTGGSFNINSGASLQMTQSYTAGGSLQNAGTVSTTGGFVSFRGGGASTGGVFNVAAGTDLDFGGGVFTLDSATQINDHGTVSVSGGTLEWNGPAYNNYGGNGQLLISGGQLITASGVSLPAINITSGALTLQNNLTINQIVMSGGTINGPAILTVTGTMNQSGGRVNGSGNILITGTLNLSGGNVGSSGGLTVNGQLNWTGGTISGGAVNVNSSYAQLSGSAKTLDGTTLTFLGSYPGWSAGDLTVQNGASIIVNNGVSLGLQYNGNLINGGGAASSLTVYGELDRTAGTGTFKLGVNVSNENGDVEANSGTLEFAGNYTQDGGNTSIDNTGSILLVDGNYTLHAGANSAKLSGNNVGNTATISGLFIWSSDGPGNSSSISGNNLTVNAMGGTKMTNNGVSSTVNNNTLNLGSILNLYGQSTWDTVTINTGGGVLNNNGTLTTSGGRMTGSTNATVNNLGTLVNAVGTTEIDPAFVNTGTVQIQAGSMIFGSVYTQTAGTTLLSGGSLTSNGTLNLEGGTIQAIQPMVVNGTMAVSGGTLQITAGLTGTSILNWSGGTISGGTASVAGVQVAGGAMTLDGTTLTLQGGYSNWTSGNLTMQNGASFVVNTNANLIVQSGSITSGVGAASSMTIYGYMEKYNGTNDFVIGVNVSNENGEVVANAGTVEFAGNYTQDGGNTSIDNTGSILLVDGNYTLHAGANSAKLSGNNVGNTATISGLFIWSSDGPGNSSSISGNNLTVNAMGGTKMTNNGVSSTVNNNTLNLGSILNLYGQSTWDTVTINTGGGVLNNNGTLTTSGGRMTGSTNATVNNLGTLVNAVGTTEIDPAFVNTGTVQIQAGSMIFGSVSNGGQITVGSTSGLVLDGSVSQAAGASWITLGSLTASQGFSNSGTFSATGPQHWSPGNVFTNAGGTADFGTDTGATGQNLSINVTGGVVTFGSGQHLAGLSISAGANAMVSKSVVGQQSVIITSSLNVAGTLDLTDNDLDFQGGSLSAVNALVARGCSNGTWTGTGIISSTAANDSSHLTALGVLINNNGLDSPIYGTGTGFGLFDGIIPALNDVLVKYTYYGDTNLDGHVDGSDYSRIDNGYLNHLSGWQNGDFNYDGVVDGSDYTLIDNAFNTQGASLTASIADQSAIATAQIEPDTSAVPEPSSLILVGVSALALLRRRQRLSVTC